MPENRKEALCRQLLAVLDDRMADIRRALAHARESRDNDTKSSAGDKYETGRAMMQQEIDKLEHQLRQQVQQSVELAALSATTPPASVTHGTLVETNLGTYLVAVGLGKVIWENQTFHVISMQSPLGQVLKGKKTGDCFNFMGRDYVISALH